jgi:hypothetical protein
MSRRSPRTGLSASGLLATMLVAMFCAPVGADTLQKIPYVVKPGSTQGAPDGLVRAACAKDFIAFCAAGQIRDCIVSHRDDFQPACRAAIDHAGLPAQAGNDQGPRQWACVHDARSFCGNVQPGQGRIIQCLGEHLKELQPGCQSTLQAARARQRSL